MYDSLVGIDTYTPVSVKFNSDLNVEWIRTLDGGNNSTEIWYGINIAPNDKHIYLTGFGRPNASNIYRHIHAKLLVDGSGTGVYGGLTYASKDYTDIRTTSYTLTPFTPSVVQSSISHTVLNSTLTVTDSGYVIDTLLDSNASPSYSGTFDVELTIVNDYGCSFTKIFSDFIHVDEVPQVDFESTPLIGCVGQDIYFYDLSYSSDSINNWFWDFEYGDTSTFQNPVFQYDFPGQYDVTLIAGINDCKDTLMLSNYIKIMTPTAKFIEEYNCDSPLTVDFENLSLGADDVIWDFGDGNTSNLLNPSHTYISKGVYDVKLNVFNNTTGCSHEITKTIKLTIPEANFDYLVNVNNGYEDSVGCAPKQVYLQNNSQDWNHFKVIWSDGYIGYGRVDHIFNEPGEFDVMMIVTDIHGCRDTMIHNNMYKINDVQADFEITNVLGCDSMLVDFHDLSFPPSLLSWDFGDGNSSNLNNPQHIYYSEGYYDVTIYVESIDGCKDTLERKEYIQFQYPIADFVSNNQLIWF